jgi:hypothetical protein
MPISRARLKTALALTKRDLKEGADQWWWFTSGTFVRFSSDVRQSSYRSSVKDEAIRERCENMYRHLANIKSDLDTLITMCDQADWQKRMVRERHLDTFLNMEYGTALADAFITKYRSSYDTISKAFIEIRQDRGHKPRESFTALRDLCKNDYNKCVNVMGERLANLIMQSRDWYDDLLDVRDDVIHKKPKV